MKKVGIILMAVLVLLSAACNKGSGGSSSSSSGTTSQRAVETFDLALVTDLGTIDDKSFNQGSWEGLVRYARENNISHKYYQPAEQSNDAYLTTIDLAVRGGAKIVVTPGFLFEVPVYIAQDRYPNVNFILVDGVPHNADYSTFKTGKNTVGVLYAEDQAGFLAGYAAVKDGDRRLGFVGGMAVPAVVRFGCGFVQGAEFAAVELGLPAGSVTVNYHYTGVFEARPEIQTLAASWYNSGVEVIFACGGAIGNSVMAAAEQTNKKVIGVDVDQSGESRTVITSAMKGLQVSVYDCVKAYYEGKFPGGETLVFTAANNGVGLPMITSKFLSFRNSDYNAIFQRLVNGEVPRINDLDQAGSPRVVPVRIVRVTEI
ncbi:MAG: BMP family ABC transporter substrate-binding protein [Treponema sp.]|nr:BMP family ABC transporter substrate-binding protein [Treponema sp.]MCL2250595.1 BMP family ABC transporter substrate-binding protein [Treponema sp.]